MARIYIENRPYEVENGQNLLHACLSLGFDIPYFCWHPAMHSVGACRQCAVKQFRDETDTKGRIVMSCMTPATDGTRISIDDPEAKSFRVNVTEWLMANHPHDCPVCDEGGECHLQDMTVMTGHVYRRYRFKKRTYRNQYLGPFINHEMNRCIQCYRCVRFYRDYAGGRDLNVFGCHDNVYFGRHQDGVLESAFAGNLVEVCPTGVFTDKTFRRHYTRKWDLQTAPSVCVHCGVGCNTIPGERYKELRRIRNRYNSEVNGYFLCDRGRFGYEFVNHEKRIRQAAVRTDTEIGRVERTATAEEALSAIRRMMNSGAGVIGIGSPRASLEANYALRALVGEENFYAGMDAGDNRLVSLILDILKKGPVPSPTLKEVESADAVFVLGEDVSNTAPVLALALRRSVRGLKEKTAARLDIPYWDANSVNTAAQGIKPPFYVAAPFATGLDDLAKGIYYGAPEDIARLGFAVAHEINSRSPSVDGVSKELLTRAKEIATELNKAKRPLIVSGTGCKSSAVIQAAANVAWALAAGAKPGLGLTVPECNTMGLAMLEGKSLDQLMIESASGNFETAIILENDLYRRAAKNSVDELFKRFKNVIVIDEIITPTSDRAGVVLPAASFAESTGTLVNSEGRAQRFFQVFAPEGDIKESWRWVKDIGNSIGRRLNWQKLDDVIEEMAREMSSLQPIAEAAPAEEFRIKGMKVARQPHRFSGRTAIEAGRNVFEPKPPEDTDAPFNFSMEGFQGVPPGALVARFWRPGWNSPQAVTKFQDGVNGPLHGGDPGKRLIINVEGQEPVFFSLVPKAFRPRKDERLILSAFHIFGSEELSALASGIAELSPGPYIGVGQTELEILRVKEGEELELRINGTSLRLKARIVKGLPEGVCVLPAGIVIEKLPAWGRLSALKRRAA